MALISVRTLTPIQLVIHLDYLKRLLDDYYLKINMRIYLVSSLKLLLTQNCAHSNNATSKC